MGCLGQLLPGEVEHSGPVPGAEEPPGRLPTTQRPADAFTDRHPPSPPHSVTRRTTAPSVSISSSQKQRTATDRDPPSGTTVRLNVSVTGSRCSNAPERRLPSTVTVFAEAVSDVHPCRSPNAVNADPAAAVTVFSTTGGAAVSASRTPYPPSGRCSWLSPARSLPAMQRPSAASAAMPTDPVSAIRLSSMTMSRIGRSRWDPRRRLVVDPNRGCIVVRDVP